MTLSERVNPHYSLFLRFLGGTGLRYYEATALRRRDIAFKGVRNSRFHKEVWQPLMVQLLEDGSLDLSPEFTRYVMPTAPTCLMPTFPCTSCKPGWVTRTRRRRCASGSLKV